MLAEQRIVTKIPLSELWDDHGARSTTRVRNLDTTVLRVLMQTTPLQFVVANCGDKLNWIPASERFDFWKKAEQNLAEPEKPIFLNQFPNSFAYIASEWRSANGECIILLEIHH